MASAHSKIVWALMLMGPLSVSAQDLSPSTLPDAPIAQAAGPASSASDDITVARLPVHLLKDQVAIFTSPVRIRTRDLRWLLPLAGATGASLATDHRTMTTVVSRDPDFNQANVNASNGLIGGFIAVPAVLFVAGHVRGDEHAREAGLVGGEAMGDAVIVEQILKLMFWRERPMQDNGRGLFYQGNAGANSAFPSSHATVAWASAATLAAEYPSAWKQAGIYTLATGVSLTRVMGQQHFPTDVLVGSAAGWLIGHYVYRARHHISTR